VLWLDQTLDIPKSSLANSFLWGDICDYARLCLKLGLDFVEYFMIGEVVNKA
jgi:hypothetical protein